MNVQDKIISFLQINGPSLPVHIGKDIIQNSIMTSAHLSELASSNKVVISTLKVGGSPLYYLPGQENRLQAFIENLHEREQEAVHLLKEKTILEDTKLEPVTRQALRVLKDFAKPLTVTHNGQSMLYWKWYLLSNDDAKHHLQTMLGVPKPVQKQLPTELPKERTPEKEPPKKQLAKEAPSRSLPSKLTSSAFHQKILDYFTKEQINVTETTVIRKDKEINFFITMQSPMGELSYFVKARNKQRISDGDLASAHIEGQMKKLPVLLLTPGKLTKKAQEMQATELKGVQVVNKPWA